jgi:uncharacterized membrane protein
MNRSFVTSVVLALALNAAGFAARAQPTYTLTQIEPSRPDAFAIEIADLNDKGEVVGEILTESGRLGFVWRDGEMTIITGLSTGPGSLALPTAINNGSDIVGIVGPTSGPLAMFLIERGQLDDATIIDIPGATEVIPTDMNNRGDIVGLLREEEGTAIPFLRERSGEIIHLELPPGHETSGVREINARGDVVGGTISPAGEFRAVIWRDGAIEFLPLPAGTESSAGHAINDRGQVVGTASILPVLWQRGEPVLLPTAPGLPDAQPQDINNRGQIVGETQDRLTGDLVALFWENEVVYRLDDLISEDDPLEPFVRLEIARWINNRGQIVALGQNSQNPLEGRVAYLLTPTP